MRFALVATSIWTSVVPEPIRSCSSESGGMVSLSVMSVVSNVEALGVVAKREELWTSPTEYTRRTALVRLRNERVCPSKQALTVKSDGM